MSKLRILLASLFVFVLTLGILMNDSKANPIKYGDKVVISNCAVAGNTTATVDFRGNAVISVFNETTCICPATTTCAKNTDGSICVAAGGARRVIFSAGIASCWSAGSSGEVHIQQEVR